MTLSEIRHRVDARRKGEIPESIVLSLLPWASSDRYRELLRWDLPDPAP